VRITPGEKFIWGANEDCLAPLQLNFRGPCSSLAVFGCKAGVIRHLLMEVACVRQWIRTCASYKHSSLTNSHLDMNNPTSSPRLCTILCISLYLIESNIIPVHAQKHVSLPAIATSGKPHKITSKMGLENDTRGWIMTCISGVACVIGASIVCVDIAVRQFPGMEKFSIAESDAFLSASLSLSFGVMVRDPVRMNEHWLTLLCSFSPHYTACYQSRRTTLSMAAFLPPQPRTCSSAYS